MLNKNSRQDRQDAKDALYREVIEVDKTLNDFRETSYRGLDWKLVFDLAIANKETREAADEQIVLSFAKVSKVVKAQSALIRNMERKISELEKELSLLSDDVVALEYPSGVLNRDYVRRLQKVVKLEEK